MRHYCIVCVYEVGAGAGQGWTAISRGPGGRLFGDGGS